MYLAIQKRGLLRMKSAVPHIKLVIEQPHEHAYPCWQLRISIPGYPEPGIFVGNKGTARQWRSLNKITDFIRRLLPDIQHIEVKLHANHLANNSP